MSRSCIGVGSGGTEGTTLVERKKTSCWKVSRTRTGRFESIPDRKMSTIGNDFRSSRYISGLCINIAFISSAIFEIISSSSLAAASSTRNSREASSVFSNSAAGALPTISHSPVRLCSCANGRVTICFSTHG